MRIYTEMECDCGCEAKEVVETLENGMLPVK